MILHRLGLIHKNQKGFTLIELLIAIAITGIITGGATMTIFQVFSGNARSTNHMIAVRQVQNAGYWLSHDAQMAQSVAPEASPDPDGFPLTLTWTEWDGDKHRVVYTLLVDNELQREHYTNYDPVTNPDPDVTTIVAQYIDPDPAKTNCKLTAGAFSLPDIGDELTTTDGTGGDSGTITVTAGSVTATPTGGATVDGGTDPVTIDPTSGAVAWTTPAAGDTVVVAATSTNTTGDWTDTTGTTTAAITVDSNGDAILTDGGELIVTVTATVGSSSQESSETRVYRIIPRPGS